MKWKNSNIQSDYGFASNTLDTDQKDGDSAILFHGENLLNYTEKQMTHIRGKQNFDDLPGPDDIAEPNQKIEIRLWKVF